MSKIKKKFGKNEEILVKMRKFRLKNEENWSKKMRKIGDIFVPQIKIRGNFLLLCIFCNSGIYVKMSASNVKRCSLQSAERQTNTQTHTQTHTHRHTHTHTHTHPHTHTHTHTHTHDILQSKNRGILFYRQVFLGRFPRTRKKL